MLDNFDLFRRPSEKSHALEASMNLASTNLSPTESVGTSESFLGETSSSSRTDVSEVGRGG